MSKFQLGLGLGSLNSTLRFDGSTDVKIEMNTVSVSGSYQINDKWSIRSGVGLILDGKLQPPGHLVHDVKPGGLLAIGMEYLYYQGEGYRPYIDYSVFVSVSSTRTENPVNLKNTNYFSSDLRFGARASWIINGNIFPYLSSRLFGGPVSWELDGTDVLGTDIHHYQLAAGTAFRYGSLSTFVEWAALGEKALSAGLSYAW
ncbi:MAG: hypothetical protein K9N29_06735 [Candidatus Marinimicrobia bacterium]|nr:hypothetical protein [Candidatus Neomarinimicrobiota bacterium]